jgi:hypothetical protein
MRTPCGNSSEWRFRQGVTWSRVAGVHIVRAFIGASYPDSCPFSSPGGHDHGALMQIRRIACIAVPRSSACGLRYHPARGSPTSGPPCSHAGFPSTSRRSRYRVMRGTFVDPMDPPGLAHRKGRRFRSLGSPHSVSLHSSSGVESGRPSAERFAPSTSRESSRTAVECRARPPSGERSPTADRHASCQ